MHLLSALCRLLKLRSIIEQELEERGGAEELFDGLQVSRERPLLDAVPPFHTITYLPTLPPIKAHDMCCILFRRGWIVQRGRGRGLR